jgi:integrase
VSGSVSRHIKLTNLVVAKLPPSRYPYWDLLLPAFGIRVGVRTRTWIVNIRRPGKRDPTRLKLGHFPALGVCEARAAARRMMADVPEQPDNVPVTRFAALAEQFLDHGVTRLGKPLRPASMAAYRIVLNHYARPLHARPIDTIRRRDVAELLSAVTKESGTATALLVRRTLGRFWGFLNEIDVVETNPVVGTPALSLEPRSRVLNDLEIAALWRATENGSDFSLIVRLLLWCGCRRSEAGGAQWAEFSTAENGQLIWTLPAHRTKSGRQRILPLADQTKDAIKAHPRIVGRLHLFGAHSLAGFRGWHTAKLRLDAQLRFSPSWVLHDLRRVVKSKLAALGVDKPVANRILGHDVGRIDLTYDLHGYENEMAAALALWSAELQRITSQPLPAFINISSRLEA